MTGLLESGMLSALGCGCCCFAVAFVFAVAVVMSWSRRRVAPPAVDGTISAPAHGSIATARLTYMDEPENETVQLRPSSQAPAGIPSDILKADATRPAAPKPAPAAPVQRNVSGTPALAPIPPRPTSEPPRVIPASPTVVPEADD